MSIFKKEKSLKINDLNIMNLGKENKLKIKINRTSDLFLWKVKI